jgi:EAL domain-containing protein (putative c-di-GMP-specific phosphodiesterase class I)
MKQVSGSDNTFKNLQNFLSDKTSASKGRVYVLDLDALKEKIGNNWERHKQKVHSTAYSVIERRTDPSDLYDKWDDEHFLIAFDVIDEARSRIKINLIAQEIAHRLVGGKDSNKYVNVSRADTDIQGNLIWEKDADPSNLIDEPIRERDFSGAKKISAPIFSGDVGFVFRPLWYIKNQIISSYYCIPVRSISEGRFSSSYEVIDDIQNMNAIKALDLLSAKKAYEVAEKLDESHKPALIALPLHFESLASTTRKTDLVNQCAKNLKSHNRRIVTELVDLPGGIPQSRLQGLIQSIKPFSRAVMARFKLGQMDFSGFRNIGLFAVGVDIFNDKRNEGKIIEDIERFAHMAEKANLNTYIHGVRTTSLATAAICAGIDYIDGYAISEVVEHPMDIKFMTIKERYDERFGHLLSNS